MEDETGKIIPWSANCFFARGMMNQIPVYSSIPIFKRMNKYKAKGNYCRCQYRMDVIFDEQLIYFNQTVYKIIQVIRFC